MSQKHLSVVNPGARQFGLAALSVRVTVPVVFERLIGKVAITPPASGGQSRLVEPKATLGEEPVMSQILPVRCPPEHVPPRMPSFGVASPSHCGHGSLSVGPEKTCDERFAVVAADPVSTLAVPVMVPTIRLPTQVDTPPAASGR